MNYIQVTDGTIYCILSTYLSRQRTYWCVSIGVPGKGILLAFSIKDIFHFSV